MKIISYAVLRGGLFVLATAPLLPIVPARAQTAPKPATADPDAAAKAKLEIVNEGELRLDGKITALLGPGVWQIEATSWTSPRGVTTDFDEPKNKGIKVGAEAYLHPRGELDKVLIKDVKLGSRIGVIGKNGPDGTIVAREVVLLEGYGARKTVGAVRTNPITSQLVKQSREARDAGLLPKALELLERGIATAQGMGDQGGEALATQDKALVLSEMEQPEQAYTAFKRVESLGRASGNSLLMSLGMRGAGSLLLNSGRLKEAIDLLKEADPISAHTEVEVRLGVLTTLAAAYLTNENLAEAIAVMQRIHPLEQGQGKEADAGETMLMIALLQADERPDQARQTLEDTKGRIERARDDKAKAGLLGLAATVKWRLGDKDEAREDFTATANLFKVAGDERSAQKWESMPAKLEGVSDEWQDYWNVFVDGKSAKGGDEEKADASTENEKNV